MTLIPRTWDRPLYWPEIIDPLQEALADTEVYLVGGIVRDVYMRRPVHDIDLASAGDGRPIARKIANAFGGDYYPLDATRGVGRAFITWQDTRFMVDVAQFRNDNLLHDLQDRDFTANAIAVNLQNLEEVIDPLNGITDIDNRLVQMCNTASISSDPVRALRAIRLSLSHQMRLSPATKHAIQQVGDNLHQTSAERIRDELIKLLGGSKPMSAILLLDTLGLLPVIFPETQALKGVKQSPPHIFDAWRHTLAVIGALDEVVETIAPRIERESPANFAYGIIAFTFPHLREQLRQHIQQTWPNQRSHRALLILAALAHDIAKPATQSQGTDGRIHFYQHEEAGTAIVEAWGLNLALSNEEIERLKIIVRHHMRPLNLHSSPNGLSRRATYRFWRDLGTAGVDVCLFTMADYIGKYGSTLQQQDWLSYTQLLQTLLEAYYQEHTQLIKFKPLLNGNDLMQQLNLPASPQLGQLINALHEAQALGEIHSPDEALAWAMEWLKQH